METLSRVVPVAGGPVRRRGRWVVPAAVAGAVVALVAAVGVGKAVSHGGAPPGPVTPGAEPPPAYVDWPPRGADKDDLALFQTALDVWDGRYNNPTRYRMRPHSDARLLFAQRYPFGDLVVLEGANQSGERSIATVVSRIGDGEVTEDVNERPLRYAPQPLAEVSAVIQVGRPLANGQYRQYVLVLGAPGTTSITFRPYDAAGYHVIGTDIGEELVTGGVGGIVTYRGSEVTYSGAFDEGFLDARDSIQVGVQPPV